MIGGAVWVENLTEAATADPLQVLPIIKKCAPPSSTKLGTTTKCEYFQETGSGTNVFGCVRC